MLALETHHTCCMAAAIAAALAAEAVLCHLRGRSGRAWRPLGLRPLPGACVLAGGQAAAIFGLGLAAAHLPALALLAATTALLGCRVGLELLWQAKSACQDSANLTDQFLNCTGCGMALLDRDGRIIRLNAAAGELLGRPRQAALGSRMVEVLPMGPAAAVQEAMAKAFCGARTTVETAIARPDGREGWTQVVLSPLAAGDGFITHLAAAFVDLSEPRRREQDLAAAMRAAEKASQARSEFLVNMSREIGTRMTGVVGVARLALETPLSAEQRNYLDMIHESSQSLINVINDILDFSKIEAGKLELERRDFSLRDCLSAVMNLLAWQAEAKGLELVCHVAPDVPDELVGDPIRLRQVLVNLVGNALKFTDRGEVAVRAELSEHRRHDISVRFSVRDTGVGIPPEEQERIFRPFGQAHDDTTRGGAGMGLGLAIALELVRRMEGRIWVDSPPRGDGRPGGPPARGSEFHFTARLGLRAHGAPAASARLEHLKDVPVLVADDNDTNRQVLERTLARWHMRPTCVAGGREALEELRRARDAGSPFAIVLLECCMTDLDGREAARQIAEDPSLSGPVILMLSSSAHALEGAEARRLGIAAWLAKPIRQTDLLDAITKALAGAGHGTVEAAPAPASVRQTGAGPSSGRL